MSPEQVHEMADRDIVEMLVSLSPSEEAVALLSAVITDENAFEGVRELRRRMGTSCESVPPKKNGGRMPSATTVAIDPARWASFFWRRRIALADVGPMMEPPRCRGWGSAMKVRGLAGLYALDDLACALDLHVDELIQQVGTDTERARIAQRVDAIDVRRVDDVRDRATSRPVP